jgi:excinuclease ABC subunit A
VAVTAAATTELASFASDDELLRIRGARTHNLQNVDLDIPRGKLVVITGPSGSGKSSLAFDTLYAEGQRQYIESLSAYARQFLHQLQRPDVDLIEGLQPTICIDQRPGNQNPRSTVATATEIYDYLRLLMARLGEVTCHQCGQPIRQQSVEQIADALLALPEGSKAMLLAPLVRGRKGQHAEVFAQVRKLQLIRVRIDGQIYDLENVPELDGRKSHSIEAVVDRIVIRESARGRLVESIQLAVRHGEGVMVACYLTPEQEEQARQKGESTEGQWTDRLFSTLYACPNCQISFEELEPRTFSFNSPYGACTTCDGLGSRIEFDPDLIVPDPSLTLATGAIAPWRGEKKGAIKGQVAEVEAFLASHQATQETPFADLSAATLDKLFRGDGKEFLGLVTMLEKELATATNAERKERLETFRGSVVCQACHGARLRPEALSVRVGGKAIQEITRQAVSDARSFFAGLAYFGPDQEIARPILTEIRARLGFLEKVGLDYLTLDRPADTLSGGEFQRIRLATGIGSGLAGILYILDEPSIGLHPRDGERLIVALRELQQNANTVLVVEHDEAMMRTADWLIDVGPGAGVHGGRIIAEGTPAEVMSREDSLTGRYLSGRMQIAVPAERRQGTKSHAIVLEGATTNNLKDVTAAFPLGVLIGVTGVSGSGKSSLINETLAPALVRRLGGVAPKPGPHTSLRGASQIDKIVLVDQSPIGRSPRSNAATYTGALDEIRNVFAATKEAKQLGFKRSRFSFNVAGGRCEECQGQGLKKLEMNFLPDLFVTCTACGGQRYNRQTLAVKYRGQSIADVLAMPIETAADFFENFPQLRRLLTSLCEVGLGYLSLGQSSTTLSGGESQRIKLATELARVDTGQTLYLLDEPTTGLHFDDIRLLLEVLQKLVERGNTVIVIEHNLDVIKCCDLLIDLGPDGGARGGYIIATGTPEEVAAIEANETGRFLRDVLSR